MQSNLVRIEHVKAGIGAQIAMSVDRCREFCLAR